MGMIELISRRFIKRGDGPVPMRATRFESLAMAQVEDERTELARAGRRFMGGLQIIANGIAPVAAIPTTTATLALFNNDLTKSFAIHGLHMFLGSGTPAAGATLFVAISTGPIATKPVANATGYGSQSCSGASQATKAFWATGVTMPAGSAWKAVLSNMQLAAANVGQGDGFREFAGGLIVPPGYALGFGILSGAGTTPLYGISASWSELELDLE